ncbi:BatA domain-containing protein [Hymenobacter sp. UYCo722]|uniref:BatA domain-containing protein n=1 Tax=Hymenobacter sp. UYCo722 TaxID=3156335 RepID=UPI00339AF39F
MFALLNPAALLALLGLLVPVAIHLWNRRPGREVAVGSLRWLAAGANRRLRNLKPEQLWLLLLRAALVAVLAVAVAGPIWRTALPTSRGVVLLSTEAAGLPALVGLKPTIDSLRGSGYALRWLAAGFPRVPGGTWRKLSTGQAGTTADSLAALATKPRNQAFAWARVQQAVAAFPGQPLLVVTGAGLRNFGGSHAPLPAAVRWQVLPDTTSTAWLASAAQMGDTLSLLVGRSKENQTTFRRKKARKPQGGQLLQVPGLPPFRLQLNKNGGTNFVLKPALGADREIDLEAAPTEISIYATPEFAADARYLEAALRAAGTALALPPRLRRLAASPAHLQADWTFWLSAEPLPLDWQESTRKYARHLWLEAPGPGLADTSSLAVTKPGATAVTVLRRDARPPAPGLETVWADGRGRAILSRQALGRGSVYQLHTRLNPIWSELANDPQLPARLLALLQPDPTDNFNAPQTRLAEAEAAHDRRALAPAQLPAASASAALPAATSTPPPGFRTTDLRPWLVLLAGLLLLVERLLAARREAKTFSSLA